MSTFQERVDALRAKQEEDILRVGHSIMGVFPTENDPGPPFVYSIGRAVSGKPEIYISGGNPEQMARVINTIAAMENEEKIDLVALATDEPVQLEDFGCEFRFKVIDAEKAEMGQSLRLVPSLTAIQVIWPDAEGRWPEDEAFGYPSGTQVVMA